MTLVTVPQDPLLPNANLNQRWRERRDSYRPAGEVIQTSAYDVAEILDDRTAKAFVVQHHYSRSYPAARFRFGLYRQGELVGVAVFSHPVANGVITSCLPGEATDSTELGRFVLLDNVPGNGETWFIARCFEQLRAQGIVGVVSFSDPVPRTTIEGAVVLPGHVGTIYQASNAVYLGRGRGGWIRLFDDGTVLNRRTEQKIVHAERGWRHAAAILEAHGAPAPDEGDLAGWLRLWRDKLTRAMLHPGNHKYVWAIDKRIRRTLPASLPYPKRIDNVCCKAVAA